MKLIPLVEVRDILIHVDIIMRFHEMSDFEFAGKDEMLQLSVCLQDQSRNTGCFTARFYNGFTI